MSAAQRPLRILFLAPQPFFEVRGTPLAVLAMLRALSDLGQRVDLLSFPQGRDVPLAGLVHRRSLRLPVGHVKAGASLAKLLLDVPFMLEALGRLSFSRYDVVHAVEESAHLVAPFARLLGVPLIMDVDSSIPDQLRYSGFARRGPLPWLAERLERFALRRATAVVTVCTSLTEGVRALAPRATVFQIEDPPLVDGELPDAQAARALRQSLGLDNRPVVLYTGNFEGYQGVEVLVDAASALASTQFLFVGGEPHEIERLRARAARSSNGARVVFAGKRPPEDLPLLMAAATLLASPRSSGTNTPFKIYTYLASGRPLVATRISSHTQLLDDGLAFLAEPTASGLAAAIRAALADPEEAARRAAAGRALVGREYSSARFREKVARVYASISSR